MDKRERPQAEITKIGMNCAFGAADGDRKFLTADNQNAVDKLIDELDSKKIGDQSGKLVFEPVSQIPMARIEIEGVFRWSLGTRIFITYNNTEAVNMLMNKLVRKGVTNHSGLLSFEFVPKTGSDAVADICACGHRWEAHKRNRHGHYDRGPCEVTACKCQKFVLK
jgi:hypothetical protein